MGKGVKLNRKKKRSRTFQSSYSIAAPRGSVRKVHITYRGIERAAKWFVPVVLAMGLVYLVVFSSFFKITRADIRGTHRLVTADVYFMSGVDGKSIFSVSPKKVEKRLEEQVPYIKRAKVKLALPNKVIILIQEREPIVEWDNPRKPMWVSADGTVLAIVGDAFNLMHLYDQDGRAVEKDGKISKEYIKGMQILHDRLQVSDFTLGRKGLEIHDPAGWEAYFGGERGLCSRINEYLRLRDKWLIGVHPKYVDARYDNIYFGR